jgi:hypothetical protein
MFLGAEMHGFARMGKQGGLAEAAEERSSYHWIPGSCASRDNDARTIERQQKHQSADCRIDDL